VATAAKAITVPAFGQESAITTLKPVKALERWGIQDPRLYRLRVILVKNAEAVEGDYDTEVVSMVAVTRVERTDSGWLVNGEPVRLREVVVDPACYPTPNSLRELAPSTDVVNLGGLPATTDLRNEAKSLGIVLNEGGQKGRSIAGIRDRNLPGRIRISEVFQDSGDTLVRIENVESEASYTLRGILMRVGHVQHTVDSLKAGESRLVRFEHVNPYSIEVRTSGGVILATR
jgi:hypothetical protein